VIVRTPRRRKPRQPPLRPTTIHARRIYQPEPGADSSAPKQYMSDAEADAERVKTRQAMDEACGGGSS
jgi:hypothetical protein